MNTPCSQSRASVTSGTTGDAGRRTGTRRSARPSGPPLRRDRGALARGRREARVRVRRRLVGVRCPVLAVPVDRVGRGGSSVMPSHQTSPSSVSAQFVKIEFDADRGHRVRVRLLARARRHPEEPASGLIAYRRPSSPNFIQAMSSPIVSTFQPGSVGISIARFVLPQADGNAPVTCFTSPVGRGRASGSACARRASPRRAITDAIRSAKHFLPSSALPP